MPTNASRFKRLFLISLIVLLLGAALLLAMLERANIAPRRLGPYIALRALGHNQYIEGFGKWASDKLVRLDRGTAETYRLPALLIGARATLPPSAGAAGQVIFVNSAEEARRAIADAHAGDIITFLPGTYRFSGQALNATHAGNAAKPIKVRAEKLGTAKLEFDMVEGFRVSAPYWTFENLTIRGVCADHGNCEHAFHVVSQATHFVARNNIVTDFNAHFKINGDGTFMPDQGRIEFNTITNSSIRQTAKPVTLIDLVAANDWVIKRNLISDFIKGQGDRISYGAFVKGGGSRNSIERNIVLCEHNLRGVPGQRVGLSIGGGGTAPAFCRDKRCIAEQFDGVIQANLVASCSDEGIYVNRGATSKILHNTLLDTAGIMVRFPQSSADVEGNLVDADIRGANDSVLRAEDNISTGTAQLYFGWHPVRNLFLQSEEINLDWAVNPPRRKSLPAVAPADLCQLQRTSTPPVYGAFENFNACVSHQSGEDENMHSYSMKIAQ